MLEYRIRFYTAEGRLQRVEAIHAKDDGEALDRARIRAHPHRVEVWRNSDKVGVIRP